MKVSYSASAIDDCEQALIKMCKHKKMAPTTLFNTAKAQSDHIITLQSLSLASGHSVCFRYLKNI